MLLTPRIYSVARRARAAAATRSAARLSHLRVARSSAWRPVFATPCAFAQSCGEASTAALNRWLGRAPVAAVDARPCRYRRVSVGAGARPRVSLLSLALCAVASHGVAALLPRFIGLVPARACRGGCALRSIARAQYISSLVYID